ncbi:Histone H1 [Caenorhabditis elegans]|uniref:Histone H1 n=1 Tax=Caenorhabditis elegans TaxID=6239 RepID=O44895_CAEEL|nr:Histone H1 [Caenorhabditis elegans]CCD65808.1 Histone H1 [Caenorhabditis elegans]|eukprot:NP_491751.2 Uncharacterized protein CELE_ZK484.3 [Caenorhabditis elegans]
MAKAKAAPKKSVKKVEKSPSPEDSGIRRSGRQRIEMGKYEEGFDRHELEMVLRASLNEANQQGIKVPSTSSTASASAPAPVKKEIKPKNKPAPVPVVEKKRTIPSKKERDAERKALAAAAAAAATLTSMKKAPIKKSVPSTSSEADSTTPKKKGSAVKAKKVTIKTPSSEPAELTSSAAPVPVAVPEVPTAEATTSATTTPTTTNATIVKKEETKAEQPVKKVVKKKAISKKPPTTTNVTSTSDSSAAAAAAKKKKKPVVPKLSTKPTKQYLENEKQMRLMACAKTGVL